MPVEEESRGVYKLAEREIEREIREEFPGARVKAKVTGDNGATIFVNSSSIPAIIGKKGKNIERLERSLGISLNVEELDSKVREEKIMVEIEMRKKTIRLIIGEEFAHRKMEIYANEKHLFNAVVSGNGTITIRKSTNNGKKLIHAIQEGRGIYAVPL